MTADSGRIIACAGIDNFRDYGGYAADGLRLRTGLLYRSAQHRNADAADLVRVAELGLVAVIDLRGEGERSASPCPRPSGFAARVLFVSGDTAGLAPHIAAARDIRDPQQARQAMTAGYADMPFRPRLIAALRLYFQALAFERAPSLVHCAAGKDRTGLAVALLHAALGVHRDDILADYMLTNRTGSSEARFAAGAAVIPGGDGRALPEEAVRVLMSVQPAYIEAAFAAIIDRHGSVGAYLDRELNVTPEQKRRIARNLID